MATCELHKAYWPDCCKDEDARLRAKYDALVAAVRASDCTCDGRWVALGQQWREGTHVAWCPKLTALDAVKVT